MARLPNVGNRLFRSRGLRWFAVGLVAALLAALGAWPTPGLVQDLDSKSQGQ